MMYAQLNPKEMSEYHNTVKVEMLMSSLFQTDFANWVKSQTLIPAKVK